MKITNIKKISKNRYNVFIDYDFYGVLHYDIYILSKLKIGDTISIQDIDDMIKQSQILLTKERALRLLSARSYTSYMLKNKLLERSDQDVVNDIVIRMQELGLINDQDYALRYAKDCINFKKFSRKNIISALYQKGISREIIDMTMQELGQEDQEKLIFEIISKKYINKIYDEKNLRRTVAAIQRKGFNYSQIKKVIANLLEDKQYYNNYWEE